MLAVTMIAFSFLFLSVVATAQPACNTGADQPPCDGVVSLTELQDYIQLWYACSSCYPDLYDAIGAWYAGQEPVPECGDGSCDAGEDCSSCPDDCGACGEPVCDPIPGPNKYYVDVDGLCAITACSDNNPGTITEPWCTISHAVESSSTVSPGDTVYVREGTYYEEVIIEIEGNPGSPITIINYPGEQPVLDGREPVVGWQQVNETNEFLTVQGQINPNYTNIYELKIHESQLPSDIEKFMIFEDGIHSRIARWPDQELGYGIDVNLFLPVAEEAEGETEFLLDSARLTQADNYWAGAWIHVWLHKANNFAILRIIDSNSQNDHTITFDTPLPNAISYDDEGTNPDGYSIVNHPHVLDSAGEFAHTMNPDANGYYTFYFWPKNVGNLNDKITIPSKSIGIYAYDKSHVTIDGIKVIGYSGEGIVLRGVSMANRVDNVIARNCVVEDVGDTGIYFIAADNSIIEYCSIDRTGDRGAFINGGSYGKIQYNNIKNADSTGASFYVMDHGQIIGNTLRGCVGVHGNGLSVYINSEKILVAYNRFIDANSAFQDIKDFVVFGNVYDFGDGSVSMVWSDTGGGRTSGLQVYLQNTILGDSLKSNSLVLKSQNEAPYPLNYVINNILHGSCWWNANLVLNMSYNLYTDYCFNQEPPDWSLGEGEIDGRSYTLNQIFVNPGLTESSDYTLVENSPAINNGTDVSALLDSLGITGADPWFPGFDFTKDKAGNSWASPPSMGAYEFQSCSDASDCPDPPACKTNKRCENEACVYDDVPDGHHASCPDDGMFCDGTETCQSGSCQSSGNPCTDDGIACTITCQEATDSCNVPDDSLCQTGYECSPSQGCIEIPCDDGNTRSCDTGQSGICAAGTETCTGGTWGSCVRNNDPTTENCTDVTGLDEDCDGSPNCNDAECSSLPECEVMFPDDYVSWWKFDGDASDSGPGNNDGTEYGSPNYVAGQSGQGIQLDGIDDYVDLGTSDFGIYDNQELTVSLWAYVDSSVSDSTIVRRGPHISPFTLGIDDTDTGFHTLSEIRTTNPRGNYLSSSTKNYDEWYYIAITYSEGVQRVYVNDAEEINESGLSNLNNGNYPTHVGRTPGFELYFTGIVDELMIYNRSLSAAEIQQIYESQNQ